MVLNVDFSRENKWETFIDTKYGIFYTLDISNIGKMAAIHHYHISSLCYYHSFYML